MGYFNALHTLVFQHKFNLLLKTEDFFTAYVHCNVIFFLWTFPKHQTFRAVNNGCVLKQMFWIVYIFPMNRVDRELRYESRMFPLHSKFNIPLYFLDWNAPDLSFCVLFYFLQILPSWRHSKQSHYILRPRKVLPHTPMTLVLGDSKPLHSQTFLLRFWSKFQTKLLILFMKKILYKIVQNTILCITLCNFDYASIRPDPTL